MIDFWNIIEKSPIFGHISAAQAEAILSRLGGKMKTYSKEQYILKAGDKTDSMGLLLFGSALVIQEDFWGNRNILTKIMPSDLFAESFACSPETVLNISVVAQENSSVLWLNVNEILSAGSKDESDSRFVGNLINELAQKNLRLNEKLTHTSQRTTREKVLSYLSAQSQKQNKREFEIPFNRQQLADYLYVERSALSAELSKLKNDGYILFEKNRFSLLK